MERLPQEAALAASVLNDAWIVRSYPRPHQGAQRRAALIRMARTVRAALEAEDDAERVLYAVAVGLYVRDDPRFAL